jgi:AraC-like DNA-binding protein
MLTQDIIDFIDERIAMALAMNSGAAPQPFEETYSLRQAARLLGCSRQYLRKHLLRELGLAMPAGSGHGINGQRKNEKALIRRSDIDRLLQIKGLRVNWALSSRSASQRGICYSPAPQRKAS